MSQQSPQSPQFLTSSYLETALRNYLKSDDLKVKNFSVAPGNKHGEGFLSLLLRVSIEYESNSKISYIKVILKAPRESSENDLDPDDDKEILFFEEVAGKMKKIFKEIDENLKVIPEVILAEKSRGTVMMEDLKVLNYSTSDRLLGLNENQVKITVKKLAKFHAASLKILSENPKAFKDLNVGVIDRNATYVNYFYELGYKDMINEVSTWENFEELTVKMEKLGETFMEKNFVSFDVNERELNVLNHGDLWTTNLMFKYDGSEVVDVILVRNKSKVDNLLSYF